MIGKLYFHYSYLQGVLSVYGSTIRCVVQAVHELYDSHFTTLWLPDEPRKNIIVFIGKYFLLSVLMFSCMHISVGLFKVHGYTFRGSNSAIFVFASLLYGFV